MSVLLTLPLDLVSSAALSYNTHKWWHWVQKRAIDDLPLLMMLQYSEYLKLSYHLPPKTSRAHLQKQRQNHYVSYLFPYYSSSLSNKVYLFLDGASFLKVDSGGVVGLSFFVASLVGLAISFSSFCGDSEDIIRLYSETETDCNAGLIVRGGDKERYKMNVKSGMLTHHLLTHNKVDDEGMRWEKIVCWCIYLIITNECSPYVL